MLEDSQVYVGAYRGTEKFNIEICMGAGKDAETPDGASAYVPAEASSRIHVGGTLTLAKGWLQGI